VREQGTIFLGGPPLVRAATREVVTSEGLTFTRANPRWPVISPRTTIMLSNWCGGPTVGRLNRINPDQLDRRDFEGGFLRFASKVGRQPQNKLYGCRLRMKFLAPTVSSMLGILLFHVVYSNGKVRGTLEDHGVRLYVEASRSHRGGTSSSCFVSYSGMTVATVP